MPETTTDEQQNLISDPENNAPNTLNAIVSTFKVIASVLLLLSAISTYTSHASLKEASTVILRNDTSSRRRLSLMEEDNAGSVRVPNYMNDLMENLKERKKLFEDTPPEEVKYWFEYTGPLQKYFYRYSKSRGKADYFEGRDDSGVVSARFEEAGGGDEFTSFYNTPDQNIPKSELPNHYRLLDNCFSMGSAKRPNLAKGSDWYQWFGESANNGKVLDRCRVLITMNTVGAGKGSTMLWETQPPSKHASGPTPWMSEQATAGMHLERNLQEMDAMCATGLMAVRLQVLVCEPIPGVWTDWMDSMLPNCGGHEAPYTFMKQASSGNPYDEGINVEERSSPVQVVVVASAATADTCHNLKSGFMEKRVQDLILAPPYLTEDDAQVAADFDPATKTTHPDLVSSDDHDLYIGMKWSSLISTRAVASFEQASADIAAAAASPRNQNASTPEKNADQVTVTLNSPSSPFLVPSFVRMSYVSEENNKIAKWRMHGDFFHPAAWEICKDSFDMTWIPDSLSGNGGVNGICYDHTSPSYSAVQRRLSGEADCGQWWVYMAEEQMSLSPEVYANEASPPIVQGGSNHIWMLTERQRKEVVKQKICEHNAKGDKDEEKKCGQVPQGVVPLGDMESFVVNFTPNTALGKKHNLGRRPGYSKEQERAQDRELVRERKQLKGQEDIEKALFDYTVYPAALFRKDATLKAARARDSILTKKESIEVDTFGPYTVKSSYYDVTIKKPREPTLGWCQAIARKGLCTLYGEYFRESSDKRCMEACGMKKNFVEIVAQK